MATKLTYVSFAPITKVEKSEDGLSLKVFGKATDETLDGDGQIVDLKWASKALAKWLETGANMRVQHNPSLYPAGVGVTVDVQKDGAYLTGEVVEPTAMRLVEKGALRAYSVGISAPKVVRDATAPHGRIVGGEIVEVSLVDRPANPSCGIKLIKGADGDFAFDTWDDDGGAIEKASDDEDATPAGDPDSDSDSDDDGGDTTDDSQDNDSSDDSDDDDTKGKVARGNRLEESPRSDEGQGQEGQGRQETADKQAGEGGQHSITSSIDPDNSAPYVKVDLTGKTQPTITEVGKRERGSNGRFSTHSNALNHDPAHHDSTDPHDVVGDDSYDGQALHTTHLDTGIEANAETVAETRASTQVASLPDTVDHAISQQDAPDPVSASNTKQLSPERIAWFIGKSDVSTKPKREGAKFSLRGPDGEVKYPINDCSDVSDAWGLRGKSNIPKSKVSAYIQRAAKKLGCSVPGAKKTKLRKAQRKLRKQAKQIAKLMQAIKGVGNDTDTRTVKERWNDLVAKNAKLAAEKEELTTKLEKLGSQPTLGKVIRAPQRNAPVVTPKVSEAEALKRADDEVSARIEFLESVAAQGTAEQQDVAQEMIMKLRNGISKTT